MELVVLVVLVVLYRMAHARPLEPLMVGFRYEPVRRRHSSCVICHGLDREQPVAAWLSLCPAHARWYAIVWCEACEVARVEGRSEPWSCHPCEVQEAFEELEVDTWRRAQDLVARRQRLGAIRLVMDALPARFRRRLVLARDLVDGRRKYRSHVPALVEWLPSAPPASARCPVCGEAAGRAAIQCASCATHHHRECWSYNGSCAIYACGQTRAR